MWPLPNCLPPPRPRVLVLDIDEYLVHHGKYYDGRGEWFCCLGVRGLSGVMARSGHEVQDLTPE